MRISASFMLLLSMCLATASAVAQPAVAGRDRGDAAHLFAYFPKEGMRAQFDEGYRRHLDWHREKRDPLVWYGWYVAHGDRVGMFIDGSFGAPFAAFDQRVDPPGDAADGARNITPFADTAFRTSYRLRRELSTGFPLEQWQPSKSVQVFHYTLQSGVKDRFERVLLAAREVVLRSGTTPAHTWYELIVGGDSPAYMLMIARDGWQSYDDHGTGLEALIAESGDTGQVRALLDDLTASVVAVKSETWSYREDLSYFPER